MEIGAFLVLGLYLPRMQVISGLDQKGERVAFAAFIIEPWVLPPTHTDCYKRSTFKVFVVPRSSSGIPAVSTIDSPLFT